jgi:hypothetical protein
MSSKTPDPSLLSIGTTGTAAVAARIPPPGAKRTREEMYALIRQLYPKCRSIPGSEVRRALAVERELIPPDTGSLYA